MPTKKQKQQYYLGNENLPTQDAQFDYESHPEWVEDLVKCKRNILYFAENFFYITNLDEGKIKIKLHNFQKRILRSLRDHRFVITLASRQIGKALALDTPILTTMGWSTMGELKAGDCVYGADGIPCNVLHAHDILENRKCYKVVFDNGEEITADADHLWYTETRSERKTTGSIKTTAEIFNTLFVSGSKEPNHRIPTCINGITGATQELGIDPYVLGLWLGDGASASGSITIGKRDIHEIIDILRTQQTQFNKFMLHEYNTDVYTLRISTEKNIQSQSLSALLDRYNLKNNKHIPNEYLLADKKQRLSLLQGLIDSDGYVNKTGICQFYNTNIELVKQVKQLVESLGYKVTYKEYTPTFKDIDCSLCASITFTPIENVCRLSFKANRLRLKPHNVQSKYRSQWHYIKNIEEIASVPVRCITVDSKDNLYLAGRQLIPTHNTTMMTIYALWVTAFQEDQRLLIVANKEQTAINILKRIRMAYEKLPNYLKPGVTEWGKTSVVFANGSSIGISTTSSDAGRGDSCNCVVGETLVTLRDKVTHEVFQVSMHDLANRLKSNTELQLKIVDD